MLLHLLKNFLNQSKKEKGYLLLLIFTIAIGLVLAFCAIGFMELQTGNIAPEVNRDRTLFLNEVTFLQDGKQVVRNNKGYNDKFTSKFLLEHIKTMKTPEKVSIFTDASGKYDFSDDDPFATNPFRTCMTDAEFWDILTFNFIHGKPYTPQQVASAAPVAVIDTKLSMFLFGTASSIGMTFQNRGTPWKKLTVVGVIEKANPMSSFTSNVYSPYTLQMREDKFRNNNEKANGVYFYRGHFQAILTAKDKDEFPEIKAELKKIVRQINKGGKIEEFEGIIPVLNDAVERLIVVWDLREMGFSVGSLIGFFLFTILMIPVFTIMRINNSRISTRLQESGVRRSFGARKHHILFQFLFENIIVTISGGLLGIIFSAIIFDFLLSIAYPEQESVGLLLNDTSLSWSLLTIMLFSMLTGLVPAFKASRLNPVFALSDGNKILYRNKKYAYDKISGIAIGGIFLCMILVFSSLAPSLISITKLHWVSKLNARIIKIDAKDKHTYAASFQQLKSKLKKIDGIKHISFTNTFPLSAWHLNDFITPTGSHKAKFHKVDESFNNIIQMQMVEGVWFQPTKLPNKPNYHQVILSDHAAQLFFGSMDCMGQTFQDKDNITYQVTGINKAKPLRTQGSLEQYQVFVFDPEIRNEALIQLDEGVDMKTVWTEMNNVIYGMAGVSIRSYDNLSDEYYAYYKMLFPILKGLGIIVFIMLTNAGVGFFAIGWSQVRKRKKEIGIRRASGASKMNIYRMVIGEHLKTTLITIGIVMVPVSQLILFFSGSQFKMEYWFGAVGISFVFTLSCVLLAAYFPARRAAATDPVVALADD